VRRPARVEGFRPRPAAAPFLREPNFEQPSCHLLNHRLGDIAAARPLSPRADRITVNELLDDLVMEYEVNGRASLRRLRQLVKHVRRAFGYMTAAAVTPADVNQYIAARQAANVANATINRERAALKRAYSIACIAGKILAKPTEPGGRPAEPPVSPGGPHMTSAGRPSGTSSGLACRVLLR
jgi:hypothetical protein